jgi:murein DD-endopeptidase MepM/ murein hydrolase activator NlpD
VIACILLQIFRLPLPGAPIITGGYGEIRGGSTLHLGLDFGVGERIGEVPVLAAGDGYVYRIRISHTGYGKAVYIQHVGGLRTLYGHLSHLAPRGEEKVRQRQVAERRFEVELHLPPEAWPVKAGDTIGWAGNSGYSFGPHLHFEVRTRRDETLPPYAYLGLTDSLPPVFVRLGLVPLEATGAVRGQGGYHFFRLAQKTCEAGMRLYVIPETIAVSGVTGVVYTVGDRMGWSRAWTGVAEVLLRRVSGDTLYQVRWDTLTYDWRRYLHWHMDEPYNRIYRVPIERLYKEGLSFPWTRGDGRLRLGVGEVATYEVVARDFSGQSAVIRFTLRGESPQRPVKRVPLDPVRVWSIERGVLLARRPFLVRFSDGGVDSVSPARPLPLRGRMPLALIWDSDTLLTQVVAVLYPGHSGSILLGHRCTLEVSTGALVDTVYLTAHFGTGLWGPEIVLGDPLLALRSPVLLRWGIEAMGIGDLLTKRVPLYRGRQGGWDAIQGYQKRGYTLEIPIRQWGTYTIMVDTVAPVIRPLKPQGPFYLVSIEDLGSGVDPYSIRVKAVGPSHQGVEPIFPEYYAPQRRLYIPKRAGRVFRVSVRDRVGNAAERVVRF